MADAFAIPVATAAISEAVAKATNYVIPSVDSIFAAGLPLEQVDPSMIFNGTSISPGTIYPHDFENLYYNFSYLWPQLDLTGPILDPDYCQPSVCSLLLGNFLYLPNIPANAFFAALFGITMIISLLLSIRHRTWGYLIGITLGLICEVLGYIGRILISQNDFTDNPFYIYIICLTIGPAFLSFAIYTCLARIIVAYGQNLSRFKPRTYTYVFAVCDFISLVLQGSGGGLAATATDHNASRRGINIMIGGLAFQVFSITAFMIACAEYAIRVRRRYAEIDPAYSELRKTKKFQGFLITLAIATLAIYLRSIFRVAELQEGFHSRFANNEITFMVLEAGMISIATIVLTAFHPSLVFGHQWREITAVIGKKQGSAQVHEKAPKISYANTSQGGSGEFAVEA